LFLELFTAAAAAVVNLKNNKRVFLFSFLLLSLLPSFSLLIRTFFLLLINLIRICFYLLLPASPTRMMVVVPSAGKINPINFFSH